MTLQQTHLEASPFRLPGQASASEAPHRMPGLALFHRPQRGMLATVLCCHRLLWWLEDVGFGQERWEARPGRKLPIHRHWRVLVIPQLPLGADLWDHRVAVVRDLCRCGCQMSLPKTAPPHSYRNIGSRHWRLHAKPLCIPQQHKWCYCVTLQRGPRNRVQGRVSGTLQIQQESIAWFLHRQVG